MTLKSQGQGHRAKQGNQLARGRGVVAVRAAGLLSEAGAGEGGVAYQGRRRGKAQVREGRGVPRRRRRGKAQVREGRGVPGGTPGLGFCANKHNVEEGRVHLEQERRGGRGLGALAGDDEGQCSVRKDWTRRRRGRHLQALPRGTCSRSQQAARGG